MRIHIRFSGSSSFDSCAQSKLLKFNCEFYFQSANILEAVLLLELEVLLVEGVDAVNHGLDKLDLGVAETVLVGDVIGVA